MHLPDDLTEKQYRVAEFIQNFRAENDGMSPTFQEIADGLGLRDRVSAREFAERLIAKGYLERRQGRYRNLITTAKWRFRHNRRYAVEANPQVMEAVAANPAVFAGWTSQKFDRLLSRRALGGELTEEGVLAEAEKINEDERALAAVEGLLQVEPARRVLLDTIQGLLERHTPRRRKERLPTAGEHRERLVSGDGRDD